MEDVSEGEDPPAPPQSDSDESDGEQATDGNVNPISNQYNEQYHQWLAAGNFNRGGPPNQDQSQQQENENRPQLSQQDPAGLMQELLAGISASLKIMREVASATYHDGQGQEQ